MDESDHTRATPHMKIQDARMSHGMAKSRAGDDVPSHIHTQSALVNEHGLVLNQAGACYPRIEWTARARLGRSA